MAKTYFVAINWDKMSNDPNPNSSTMLWLQTYEAGDGSDVAQWVENFPYSKGWRVYPYTKKRDRDATTQITIDKWVNKMKRKVA